ncbi:parallel beta-helix repeat protein [Emericellopsis cladophorae]|uniref:Parallel beta-helix repeat protein n=1 Tax=Emericellopsis cladophorae TaxID=2686198 RepID=A0A9Q0BBE8_9HYPO|nr:parallel beta-helix repeat protein [Emericellopsis cladophorae]KAI6778566.1 parallel beta-helix repeat protein [Emericellopsis cladophorae]
MTRISLLANLLAFAATACAQCGAGNPGATVDGSSGNYVATANGGQVYAGSDYRLAIQTAIDSVSAGQRVSVLASGGIGASSIDIPSGKTFEVCGTLDVGFNNARGAIRSLGTSDVSIPYLTMTGNPYFGMQFYGTSNLHLGEIVLNLSGGIGIRFDRDAASNSDVSMDSIRVTGAGSHAVETFNINGLTIGEVIATDCGESGLLIQTSTDVQVGYVEGNNVGAGTGYATLRFANNNGQLPDGSYDTNVYVDRVVSRGGGRGVFCVSQSGGAEIGTVDLADNGNNAILIENCYNLSILGGTVSGGGEVRLSARDEFPNTRDISITLRVDGTTVRESPQSLAPESCFKPSRAAAPPFPLELHHGQRRTGPLPHMQTYFDNFKAFPVTDNLKVQDVWDKRFTAGMANFEEGIASHWSWGRIVLAGDAAASSRNAHT